MKFSAVWRPLEMQVTELEGHLLVALLPPLLRYRGT